MTHYHIYIAAGNVLDGSSKFFKVGIGASKQANRDYLFLLAHATDNGHFFEAWSDKVDEFLMKIRHSLGYHYLPMEVVDARSLVRAIKSGTAIPLNQSHLHAADQQRKALDLNYRIITNLKRKT